MTEDISQHQNPAAQLKDKLIPFPERPIPKDMNDVLTRAFWHEALTELLSSFRDDIVASEAGLLRSHETHYKAFEGLYGAFVFIKTHADKAERRKLEKQIDKALETAQIRTKTGATLPQKLLKLTLGGEDKKRARISLYAQALNRAYLCGIKPSELADYLLRSGGWAGTKKEKDLIGSLVAERDDTPAETTMKANAHSTDGGQ